MTQVCKQFVTPKEVQGSAAKPYIVTLYSADYPFPNCTCTAYAIKRNRNRKDLAGKGSMIPGDCKHVQRELANTCTYIHPTGVPALANNICPDCGGPLVDLETHVSISMDEGVIVGNDDKPTKPKRTATDKAVAAAAPNVEDLLRDLVKGAPTAGTGSDYVPPPPHDCMENPTLADDGTGRMVPTCSVCQRRL